MREQTNMNERPAAGNMRHDVIGQTSVIARRAQPTEWKNFALFGSDGLEAAMLQSDFCR